MKLQEFLERFESMTLKDLASNYEGIKNDISGLSAKVKDISDKYSRGVNIDQMPDMLKEIGDIIMMLK